VLFYQIYAKILACALNISILHVAKIKTIKNVQKRKIVPPSALKDGSAHPGLLSHPWES
jgi:hypothetical protein